MANKNQCSMGAYGELSKKWAMILLKDLFFGPQRFNDFLEIHKDLSNRVLSDQLKGLEKHGFIKKEVVSVTPIKIQYALTELGYDLNKVIYEKVMFAIRQGLVKRNDPYFKGKNIEELFRISCQKPTQ